MHNNQFYIDNLIRNGGLETYNDLLHLQRENPKLVIELYNWLETQPLQRDNYYQGQRYVFAHALFNEKLFKENPNYSLKDIPTQRFGYNLSSNGLLNVIWYRKGDSYFRYDPSSLPTNSIMIIGHTEQGLKQNLDLVTDKGKRVKVICVDGGVCRNGVSLIAYTNGRGIKLCRTGDILQARFKPNPTQPITRGLLADYKNLLDNYIICILTEKGTDIEIIKDALLKNKFNDISGSDRAISILRPLQGSIKTLLDNLMIMKPSSYLGIRNKDLNIFLNNYINEVALNYIISSLKERYNDDLETVSSQIIDCLMTSDERYITSFKGARNVIHNIGLNNIRDIIKLNDCKNIVEYMGIMNTRKY